MNTNQKTFYFFALPGLFVQSIGAYLYFILAKNGQVASAIYTFTKILLIILPIYWIITKEKNTATHYHKKSVILGLISGLIIMGTVLGTFFIFSNYFFQFKPIILSKITNLHLSNHYILFALFLSIIHSGIEEYYWRWFIFNGLQTKFNATIATLMAGVAFSLHHYIVLSQLFPLSITIIFGLSIMLAGIIWCQIYNRTNSLIGSWISHICADLAIMTVGYMLIF